MKKLIILSTILSSTLLISFTSQKKYSAKYAMKVLQGFCEYVPSGNAVHDGDTVSVQSFYMSKTEITNFQYLEFLMYLKKHGRMDEYKKAQIDSTGWKRKMAFGEPFVEQYHKHPAYHDFPVVNVSKESAQMYCEWLTEAYDSISNGELKLKFRLPTRAEYLRAARGDMHNSTYSWGTGFVRNTKGEFLGNFVAAGDESISRDPDSGELIVVNVNNSPMYYHDGAFATAPAKSYFPNELGFYNMNGNVSEMISDGDFAVGGDWHSPGYDIRCESIKSFSEPNPMTGFRVIASYMQHSK
jgi:formylglycine-generating enzyme required for sulfatase activity